MRHEVVEASNGDEALAIQEVEPVDVLLTDLIMPEKEGLETIGVFLARYPDVRIIAMSGGGRGSAIDYLNVAKAMGADGILAKPFSNQLMAEVIDEVLGRPDPE
jgi:YesN/AraC family two-component response regulator